MEVTGYLRGFDPQLLSSLAPELRWIPITATTVFVLVLVYGLLLGLSKAFNLNELERHSKSELLNAGATFLMVIFLVSILSGVESFSLNQLLCNSGVCRTLSCGGVEYSIVNPSGPSGSGLNGVFDVFKCRLSEKAFQFSSLQEQVSSAAALPMFLLNMSFGLVGVTLFSGNMVSDWYFQVESYRFVNQLLTTFLISTNALIVIAQYVKVNMLAFFLPVGLLLRSFYFTRGLGAFLMSIAIGLYFIFPVVYILTDPGYSAPVFRAPPTPPSIASPLCYPTFSGVIYNVYNSASASSPSTGSSTLTLSELRSGLASAYLSILIHPFLSFAVTMVFVRYMIYVLGGDSQDLFRAVGKVI